MTLDTIKIDTRLIVSATEDFDLKSLELWSSIGYGDAKEALDEIDRYDVSPEMQPAKDELKLALQDFKWACYYSERGAKYYDADDLETSGRYVKSATKHLEKHTDLLPEITTPTPTPVVIPSTNPEVEKDSEKEWDKTFGGPGNDFAESVQQTSDGGYILAGYTESYGAGDYDFWLVKVDSNGNKQWDKTFGGTDKENEASVQQTSDGGYIIAGNTFSYGAGSYDIWLIKTNSNGEKLWDKTFGGTNYDDARSVQQTSDGGYILAGSTESYGAGKRDVWLIKTDSNGNKQWDKTFGGTDIDWVKSVQQTSDGGYILAGSTFSYGAGDGDVWLIKIDSNGNKQWDKTFGGTEFDKAFSVQQTSDSGYILIGETESYGAGDDDIWLIKTDSNGNKQWDKTFGGASLDFASSVQQTSDGGYILIGSTELYGAGEDDLWLIKIKGKQKEPSVPVPGFGVIFAICSVLAVAFGLRKRRWIRD